MDMLEVVWTLSYALATRYHTVLSRLTLALILIIVDTVYVYNAFVVVTRLHVIDLNQT